MYSRRLEKSVNKTLQLNLETQTLTLARGLNMHAVRVFRQRRHGGGPDTSQRI